MVQVHALAHGIECVRATDDLDVLLRVEVTAAVISQADRALSQLGYELQEPVDARSRKSAHYRYLRNSVVGRETVDVMIPDHAPPNAVRRLHGRPMFIVEGGTQAGKRRISVSLVRDDGESVGISTPDQLGALVLKGAAYSVDRRDRDRHLQDAAVLAACITDHALEVDRLVGSDRRRIRALARALNSTTHPAWLALGRDQRILGQDTLRILAA
jgi:hypothetical protein